ncbi:hypothetical protein QAD02_010373 [Eretmocerus hayati]|uniref:Uncharacterized protein n=1 Tax=Eretmocerus hayati TaxID=131215 RepID=A0ACC2NC11_9HYME|nr:hypothetical protein QAD02_010373 [Eretmocerus hayati]
MEWKTIGLTLLVVSLCLLAIPIHVNNGPEEKLAASSGTEIQDAEAKVVKLFESYVAEHKKPYRNNPSEYQKRFAVFQQSLQKIEKMNRLRSSNDSARYGITKFSDMTEEEFLASNLRSDIPVRSEKHRNCEYHHTHSKGRRSKRAAIITAPAVGLPLKFDWRDQGVVTAVKSQGTCGACWAFSSIEVAESMFAISNKTLYAFSVQEMIDCAKNSNFGCEGGDICSLLEWLVATKTKILPEVSYPLTRTTDTCRIPKKSDKSEPGVRISDFTCDNFVDAEDELMRQIVTKGPVAAAVNALTWQNYLGGVIQYHCDGSFASLNHAVQIVGYDMTGATPHYLVRNSWGTKFGDQGYIYIAIGSNLCGIANQVSTLDVVY